MLFVLISFGAFCQPSQTRVESVSISFTPLQSFRQLNFSKENKWVSEIRHHEEIPAFGFQAGASVMFRRSKNWSLETGAAYSENNFKTRKTELEWPPSDQNLPMKAYSVFHYKFISFPAKVYYDFHLCHAKWKISLMGGLTPHIFLSKKTDVVSAYSNGSEQEQSSSKFVGYRKFTISSTVGVCASYRLSRRIGLSLTPAYEQWLTSVTADKGAKEFLYNFGATSKITYWLK